LYKKNENKNYYLFYKMLVYILSNTNQSLGVFSTLLEAQKYYSTLYRSNDPLFPIKLEEFTLNGTSGKDMTLFLKVEPKNYIFEQRPFTDIIYECDNCGGEDCRDGCVNDNYDF
jgi:hypothetical protein